MRSLWFPVIASAALLLCSCASEALPEEGGSDKADGFADAGGTGLVLAEGASCLGLATHENGPFGHSSSPTEVCEGVKAALEGTDCYSLSPDEVGSSLSSSSSAPEVCEGVKALLEGRACYELSTEFNAHSAAASSSAKDICDGVFGALEGRCPPSTESNNKFGASSSPREVCEGVMGALTGSCPVDTQTNSKYDHSSSPREICEGFAAVIVANR